MERIIIFAIFEKNIKTNTTFLRAIIHDEEIANKQVIELQTACANSDMNHLEFTYKRIKCVTFWEETATFTDENNNENAVTILKDARGDQL